MSLPIDRRTFVLAALTTLGAAPASGIIDTHVHFYDPRRPQGVPWPPRTETLLYKSVLPDSYEALVGPLGVSGAVVVEASAWLEDNQWLLDLATKHRIIVGVVGNLQPDGFAANLERFARNPLFRGIRVGGGSIERRLDSGDLRLLAEADLTLDVIGSASMAAVVLNVADKLPRLRIVINHMPVEPTGWTESPAARNAIYELAARPHVFAKVSGVLRRIDGKAIEDVSRYKAGLDEVWERFGRDRVMYGSNWPVSDRLASYPSVLGVVQTYLKSRPAEDAQRYFLTNSQACYRWIPRL